MRNPVSPNEGEVMEVMKMDGVVISLKEMYQSQQEGNRLLQRLEARLESLEAKVAQSYKADERSREALEKAKDAEESAKNANQQIKRIEDKTDRIMIGVILALVSGAIGALFYFAQTGIGG